MLMNKRIILSVVLVSLFVLPLLALGQGVTVPNYGPSDFPSAIGKIVTQVGNLIAGLGTVMFVISGILYIGSTANPELRGTAKKALIYSILGMVLGLCASAIVSFVSTAVKP